MTRPIVLALAALSLSAGQAKQAPRPQAFTGIITDSECSMADHSRMQMGPTDAECVKACISAHGAQYVLYDGKNVYTLSDQQAPAKFAAQKVRVLGMLDAKTKTIKVESIAAGS